MLKVRTLTAENLVLTGQVKEAKEDSIQIELLRGITIQDLTRTVTYLEDALPSWYEKPATVAFITMLVTIWSVLKMVSISI